jgi:hypothetical protein
MTDRFFDWLVDHPAVFPAAVILGTIIMMMGSVYTVAWLNVNYWDAVPVRVIVDDQEVYAGVSACVKVESTGSTTKVLVYKRTGVFCWTLKKAYVSNNVHVEGEK